MCNPCEFFPCACYGRRGDPRPYQAFKPFLDEMVEVGQEEEKPRGIDPSLLQEKLSLFIDEKVLGSEPRSSSRVAAKYASLIFSLYLGLTVFAEIEMFAYSNQRSY